jgi:hypothetical protein
MTIQIMIEKYRFLNLSHKKPQALTRVLRQAGQGVPAQPGEL